MHLKTLVNCKSLFKNNLTKLPLCSLKRNKTQLPGEADRTWIPSKELTLIKLTVFSSLLLQLEVSEAIPHTSAAVVYFPLICCNLEGIDLMPRLTRTRFTDMDCCKAGLIDAERCSSILNEKAMKQVTAWQPTSVELLLSFTIMLLETHWLKRHDACLASVIFLSSLSVSTVSPSENIKPQANATVNELPRVSMWRPHLVKHGNR